MFYCRCFRVERGHAGQRAYMEWGQAAKKCCFFIRARPPTLLRHSHHRRGCKMKQDSPLPLPLSPLQHTTTSLGMGPPRGKGGDHISQQPVTIIIPGSCFMEGCMVYSGKVPPSLLCQQGRWGIIHGYGEDFKLSCAGVHWPSSFVFPGGIFRESPKRGFPPPNHQKALLVWPDLGHLACFPPPPNSLRRLGAHGNTILQ